MRLIHIIAGLIALAAGAVALYAAKGSRLHRRSGRVFVAAMLVMTSSAVVMATFLRPHAVNAIAGTLTFYLVATALLTVKRTVAEARAHSIGFMLLAFAVGAFALRMGFEASASATGTVDGIPAPPIFLFAAIGLLGALGDARMLGAGVIEGPRRIARHLWRMTFAMWIATASFFLGQAKFFPEPLRSQAGLRAIPVLAVLGVLIYWLVRVRVRRARTLSAMESPK